MNKSLLLLLCLLHFSITLFAQEEEQKQIEKPKDTVVNTLEGRGISFEGIVEKQAIDPLAPSRAAFYSAILPGLGQFYNKKGAWFKIPIIYGTLGSGIYIYSFNNTEYNRYRDAFKRRQAGFTDDEFWDLSGINPDKTDPDVSDLALENAQERFQRSRDVWLIISIGMYALNIIEANVTAHLKQHNVDENLSMDIKPVIDLAPITLEPTYGLALNIKF